jgi:hypothetical protein
MRGQMQCHESRYSRAWEVLVEIHTMQMDYIDRHLGKDLLKGSSAHPPNRATGLFIDLTLLCGNGQ